MITSKSGEYPFWLIQKAPDPHLIERMKGLLDNLSLHTVCEAAQCPNQGQCFASGTATFLIMGDICTRNCSFCGIDKGHPWPLDTLEPENVARAVGALGLKHVVITSVTRDDLSDGGASHFARTIEATRLSNPDVVIEVLIPDFQGSVDALKTVAHSGAHVIGHNVETVPSLYARVRPKADYRRSLDILRAIKSTSPDFITKSGLMLGLGESKNEIIAVMRDLRSTGCDCLTLGQYLPPSAKHYPVVGYVTPQEFEDYKVIGEELGFDCVFSAPLVRSSFRAAEMYQQVMTGRARANTAKFDAHM
jgi:lipoic acid synthetase